MGDDEMRKERDNRGVPNEPLGGVLELIVSMLTTIMGGGEGKASIVIEKYRDFVKTLKHKCPSSSAILLRVNVGRRVLELDAVMENMSMT